jgi:ketosteroid isomerase-like protein
MKTPVDVFHEMHALVRAYDISVVDCYAPDGVLELPFAPPPLAKRYVGRDAIRAALAPRYQQRRAAGLKLGSYHDLVIHETRDPTVIVAEFSVESEISASQTQQLAFAQVYRVVDGLIVLQRDYFDSFAMVQRLRSPAPEVPAWLTAALAALRAGDVAGWMSIYTDDAVHEFPFAADGRPDRLEGKAAIAEYMKQLPGRVHIEAFEDVHVREAGRELIVEAVGKGKRPDGTLFHMQYVWIITHDNGRVSRFRDYMNRRS